MDFSETPARLNDAAVLLTQAGNPAEAIGLFRKAIAQEGQPPKSPAEKAKSAKETALLYFTMAVAEQKTGDYEAAIGSFHRAIALQDDFSDAWAALGLAYYETSRFDLSEPCYQKALAIERTPDTLNNLGVLYFNREKYEKARECFESDLVLNPFQDDARYNLQDTMEIIG
jgi:tetratricopeptide (TPR) repeat protein